MEADQLAQTVWVVIPASGVGSRMQSKTPKQYLTIQGKSVLEHTIRRFVSLPDVAGILVVVSESDTHWDNIKHTIIDEYKSQGLSLLTASGGKDRSDTVLKGLSFLSETQKLKRNQWVMVHDAARPCVLEEDIHKLLAVRSLIGKGGAILAVPVRDTLKLTDAQCENIVFKTQSRENVWQAQTPQLCRLGVLLESIQVASQSHVSITDEASAMEYNNVPVRLVEGSSSNIKLTTPSDLRLIDFLLSDLEKNNGF